MVVPPSLSSQRLCTTLLWAPTSPAQAPGMNSQPTLWLKVRTSVPQLCLPRGDTGSGLHGQHSTTDRAQDCQMRRLCLVEYVAGLLVCECSHLAFP